MPDPGDNFPGQVEGARQLLGFYTTRVVEAQDKEHAEQVALDLLRGDERLQSLKPNSSPDDPPASLHFEEIEPANELEDGEVQAGFTFFEME
ncbi:hypothetical protein H9L13_11505 [Sphingomonas lutea]|uniref:Uncharacterized protein n=1 Tax=Sphingomonas lutea TaxID=1045317 RepID=A0A7G9SH97_9SPHN|nr:hypothetical protein [Sphingomonas lutea]QNN67222.1 hypothetical protein H9L13_11505 [Sphingomonas lutea]